MDSSSPLSKLLDRSVKIVRGNQYEDFEIGMSFSHHWGRTLNSGDNSLFTTLTLHFNPLYFNDTYARSMGHEGIVVNPLLVLNTVLGLSVEDLSEGGGPFLGITQCKFLKEVYEGETLVANSIVVDMRASEKKPNLGIVTWETTGSNQNGEEVVSFRRANLVTRRGQDVYIPSRK